MPNICSKSTLAVIIALVIGISLTLGGVGVNFKLVKSLRLPSSQVKNQNNANISGATIHSGPINSSGVGKISIGLIKPSFTAGAYNKGGFYAFYKKHQYQNYQGISVTSELNMLTSKIPSNVPGSINYRDPLITPHLKQLLPNASISVLTDEDVHYNRIEAYQIIMLFHQEYVTQQEYDNLRNFVLNGGTLILFDANVFMGEVRYNPTNNSVSLVSGHTWRYNGHYASLGPIERWAAETSAWVGSNYYYTTPNVTFYNNPFGYRHGEEQVVTADPATIKIISNYHAINHMPRIGTEKFLSSDKPLTTTNPLVATYEKDYGKGRVLVMGIYGDQLINNPAFLKFFDTVFTKYGLSR